MDSGLSGISVKPAEPSLVMNNVPISGPYGFNTTVKTHEPMKWMSVVFY